LNILLVVYHSPTPLTEGISLFAVAGFLHRFGISIGGFPGALTLEVGHNRPSLF